MAYVLTIADYNYSSWSMRPWLVLRHIGIQFEERRVEPVEVGPDAMRKISPSGKVPFFEYDGRTVWESLAICELLNELFPSAHLWPRDRTVRAHARAVSCEMAAGFTNIRNTLPMNIRARVKHAPFDDALAREVDRVKKIWTDCVAESGGPFLYGPAFSIADAMYAPVVTRFKSYGVAVDEKVAKYMQTIDALPAMKLWCERAQAETHRVEEYERVAASLPPQSSTS
jgi:glutathione S-transferase